jgi:fructosamine-3-kinase
MESKTKNRQTRERIEHMAMRAFGVGLASDNDAAVELKDGWFNATYAARLTDGRDVVLKVAPPPGAAVMGYEANIIRTEVATMRLVRHNSAIPVPEIHAFDDACDLCDAPYFFMEKLAGESLEHVRNSLPDDVQASIRFQIGAIVRAINGFTGSYFGYPGNPELRAGDWKSAFLKIVNSVLADGAARNVDYGFPGAELRSVVEKHAAALEEVRIAHLVHWDAWDPNFFVRDGRITGLLDFERALWGDPLMEAQFRPIFGRFGADILRGYGKTTFTPEEVRRSFLYMWHLGLVMITECAYRNYDTDDIYKNGRGILAHAMNWLRTN